MQSFVRLLCAVCDHLLELMPDPARAKRLDDIVDPDDGAERPGSLRPVLAAASASGPRQSAGAATKRAAS